MTGPANAPACQFDHLVVAMRSLDEAVAEFQALAGVKAASGGRHPGRGTENALISLGPGQYLELIAPQPQASLSARDEGMRTLDRLRIISWAVAVGNVGASIDVLARAGFAVTAPRPGSRVTPTGERLEWTTFELAEPPSPTTAPFFIHWSPSTKHPSVTAPGGCRLSALTIHDPRSDSLAAVLTALDVRHVSYATGPSRLEAVLMCGALMASLTTA